MPRYEIHIELFVRPAQEDEGPVFIEISEERAGPLLVQEWISPAPLGEDVKSETVEAEVLAAGESDAEAPVADKPPAPKPKVASNKSRTGAKKKN